MSIDSCSEHCTKGMLEIEYVAQLCQLSNAQQNQINDIFT